MLSPRQDLPPEVDDGDLDELQEPMEDLNLNNVSSLSRFTSQKSPNKLPADNFDDRSNLHTAGRFTAQKMRTKRFSLVSSINNSPQTQTKGMNPITSKRKRNISAPNEQTTKPADKKHITNKHVTFNLQNNPVEDGAEAGPSTDDSDYQVIDAAAPIWRSALSHRTHQSRANLRANMYHNFIDTSCSPRWAYGLEKIPDYMRPLSSAMIGIYHNNAKALTQQTYLELLEREQREKKLGEHHEKITQSLYDDVQNKDYNRAANRAAGILGAYRAQEVRKITAYRQRETNNRPREEEDWKNLLTGRPAATTTTSTSSNADRARQPSRSNKRRRSGTRSPTPARSTTRNRSPGASLSSNRGRGRGRGRAPTPSNDKEMALLSALRAFMK